MIYLRNTTESQAVFIPRNGDTPDGDLVLHMASTIDHVEYFQVVTDLKTSDIYFSVGVDLPAGLPDGEYEYTLTADGIAVSTGLMVLGEPSSPSQYERDITYEQYETE